MIVDEKQRYLKIAKILRIAFIVLLALLSAFVMVVGVITMIRISEMDSASVSAYFYCLPLVLTFTALSFMALLFQIVSKNSKISCVANILFMLSAIVCAIMSAVHLSWSVVYVIAVFLGVYIILSGLFIIRGRYIVEQYPIATIVLNSIQLVCACAALCMLHSFIGDLFWWFWRWSQVVIVVSPCITALVLGAGISAYLLSGIWWCDSCNKKNKGKAKFCCGCGKPRPVPELPVKPKREKRVKPAVATAAPAPQQTAPVAQAPQQAAPVQTAEQQEDWFCGECGTKNEGVSIFCENCGTKNPFKQ